MSTLTEVRNRADLIIYWGTNPVESHPRHLKKFALMPKGKFVPRGRKDRTMVLVDVRETLSARASDLFLQIHPGADFEGNATSRAIRVTTEGAQSVYWEFVVSVPADDVQDTARSMRLLPDTGTLFATVQLRV